MANCSNVVGGGINLLSNPHASGKTGKSASRFLVFTLNGVDKMVAAERQTVGSGAERRSYSGIADHPAYDWIQRSQFVKIQIRVQWNVGGHVSLPQGCALLAVRLDKLEHK